MDSHKIRASSPGPLSQFLNVVCSCKKKSAWEIEKLEVGLGDEAIYIQLNIIYVQECTGLSLPSGITVTVTVLCMFCVCFFVHFILNCPVCIFHGFSTFSFIHAHCVIRPPVGDAHHQRHTQESSRYAQA